MEEPEYTGFCGDYFLSNIQFATGNMQMMKITNTIAIYFCIKKNAKFDI